MRLAWQSAPAFTAAIMNVPVGRVDIAFCDRHPLIGGVSYQPSAKAASAHNGADSPLPLLPSFDNGFREDLDRLFGVSHRLDRHLLNPRLLHGMNGVHDLFARAGQCGRANHLLRHQ